MRFLLFITLLTCICTSNASRAQAVDTVCASAIEVYYVTPQPGSKYFWNVDGGRTLSALQGDSIVVHWNQGPGLYTIRVIEQNAFGCFGDTLKASILIKNRIFISVSGPSEICEGETVELTANGGQWYFWAKNHTEPRLRVRPDATTTYRVIGYERGCPADTAWKTIKVNPKPRADFQIVTKNPHMEDTIEFVSTSSGVKRQYWFFENEAHWSDTMPKALHVFKTPGVKNIKLVVHSEAGCTDSVTYSLRVLDDMNVFVPNVFTPNGDGLNDVFKALAGGGVSEFLLQIYDRWGELLFESNDIKKGWDGTYKGLRVQQDVYLYQISLSGTNKQDYHLKGNVTVLW